MKQCKACNEMYDFPHATAGWNKIFFLVITVPIVELLIQILINTQLLVLLFL